MILRILILTCAILISPSLGKLDLQQFVNNFEEMCFQNEEKDPYKVNGQDTPLSNTLENFIAMAEKFEAANTGIDLNEELAYFISEYVFENIKFTNGNADEWKVGRANFQSIDEMWDPDFNAQNKPVYKIPFSDPEKCSLYHMISHSIVKKEDQVPRSYSPGNFSSDQYSSRAYSPHLQPEDYFPQEIGVVAIQGTDAAVSLSKVLIGLYVGLKQNRKSELSSYESVKTLNIPPEDLPTDTTVDALYAVTMADVMMRATWTSSDRRGLAPNGKWVSIPIGEKKEISDFCPMVYKQELLGSEVLPAYSYSSVRGAADGLILGLAIKQVYDKKPKTRLSQILRMYYSPDGISVTSSIEDINRNHISFCSRESDLHFLESKLQDQMKSYGYLITQASKDVKKGYSDANALYNKEKQNIFQNSHSELKEYCGRQTTLDKPENLLKETYLDVIVVMDSSNDLIAFQEQQRIVGNLAKRMDLRYTGSRMTILLDSKSSEASGSSKIELESVVFDTYSSSCAACSVGQIEYKASTLPRDEVVIGLDQFLQEKKINDTQLLGVNGKVVVFFNYANDDRKNDNGRLARALKDFHLRHQDVIFYVVGIESEVLRKYARNDASSILLSSDGEPYQVGKTLFEKISFAPALLQLADCKDESTERTFSYDSLITPHIVQHYEMPAEYFYKSLKVSFKFESKFGKVRVCHNRATGKAENEARNCKNATGNDFAEFKITNPCKGFSKETCSPFFFSVIGMNSNEGEMRDNNRPKEYCNDLNDKWCSTLDQIKFTVSHTGVRCSGCLGLGASSVTMLLTIVFTFFIQKRF